MRLVVLACVLLAGCGPSPQWTEMSRAQLAEKRAKAVAAVSQAEAYNSTPTGIAALGCQTKTQFAMAGHRPSSFLDLVGDAKANQMHGSCMEYWRRTGKMP